MFATGKAARHGVVELRDQHAQPQPVPTATGFTSQRSLLDAVHVLHAPVSPWNRRRTIVPASRPKKTLSAMQLADVSQ